MRLPVAPKSNWWSNELLVPSSCLSAMAAAHVKVIVLAPLYCKATVLSSFQVKKVLARLLTSGDWGGIRGAIVLHRRSFQQLLI